MATTYNFEIISGATWNGATVNIGLVGGGEKSLAGATIEVVWRDQRTESVVLRKERDDGITVTDEDNAEFTIDAIDNFPLEPGVYDLSGEVVYSDGVTSFIIDGITYVTENKHA